MVLADHQTLPHTWWPEIIVALILVILALFLGLLAYERTRLHENHRLGRILRWCVVIGVISLVFAALLAIVPINTNNGRVHCGTALFPEGDRCGDARRTIQLLMVAMAGLGTVLLGLATLMTSDRYG